MNELEDKLKATVLAAELTAENERPSFIGRTLRWAVPAMAATAIALLVMLPGQPEDSFDSPELAYAEVEKTFALISQKIDKGAEMADLAVEPIQKIQTVFK